ncbi:MAG: ferrous iron transport protein A [Candidatus Zixiibacteriota bacterium]
MKETFFEGSATTQLKVTDMIESKAVPLSTLEPEETAIIQSVKGKGAFRRRLLDIGFRAGVHLTVVKQAPLADPVEYLLDGCHISLRREEAKDILVERLKKDRGRFRFRWRRGRR